LCAWELKIKIKKKERERNSREAKPSSCVRRSEKAAPTKTLSGKRAKKVKDEGLRVALPREVSRDRKKNPDTMI
jgi:hypothetical protein